VDQDQERQGQKTGSFASWLTIFHADVDRYMKTGQCRLCLKSAELRESHIVSRFIWRDSGLIGANKNYSVACTSHPERSERCTSMGSRLEILGRGASKKFPCLSDAVDGKNVRSFVQVANNLIGSRLSFYLQFRQGRIKGYLIPTTPGRLPWPSLNLRQRPGSFGKRWHAHVRVTLAHGHT
jgi:hypothetical protein